MADLELYGVLDGMEAFPLPLTPDVLRSVRIQPHLLEFWQEWLERARQANIDEALCDTVAQLVTRERFEQSSAGRAMRMFVRRPLSSIGFTPSRLREIDVALLQGRGLRTFQKMREWLRS